MNLRYSAKHLAIPQSHLLRLGEFSLLSEASHFIPEQYSPVLGGFTLAAGFRCGGSQPTAFYPQNVSSLDGFNVKGSADVRYEKG